MSTSYTILPYFSPPSKEICFHTAKIIKMTELEYYNATKMILNSGEITPLETARIALAREGKFIKQDYKEVSKHKVFNNSDDIGNFEWAVLITNDTSDTMPKECYLAMLDIYTRHWKVLLDDPYLFGYLDLGYISQWRIPQIISIYSLSPNDAKLLLRWDALLAQRKNRRLQRALLSWWSSYMRRYDNADIIVNSCQALEALFIIKSELRLRLSLHVYYFMQPKDKEILVDVYEMYKLRSESIHGSKIIKVKDSNNTKSVKTF